MTWELTIFLFETCIILPVYDEMRMVQVELILNGFRNTFSIVIISGFWTVCCYFKWT